MLNRSTISLLTGLASLLVWPILPLPVARAQAADAANPPVYADPPSFSEPHAPVATPSPPAFAPAPISGEIRPPAGQTPPNEPVDVMPPLSIHDSLEMLRQAVDYLERPDDLPDADKFAIIDRVLQNVMAYVDHVDQAHPTLPYYQWRLVADEKVPLDGWNTEVLKPHAAVANVTAFRVRVQRGDVQVSQVLVIDENRTQWKFNVNLRLVAGQPRPEIFFLPLPTLLKEIRVTCRPIVQDAGSRPRLRIEAGISARPELAKQANFHLQGARGEMKNKKPAEAAQKIRLAYSLLRLFQHDRQL